MVGATRILRFLLIAVCFSGLRPFFVLSQEASIDSLLKLLGNPSKDTNTVQVLLSLGKSYSGIDYSKAIEFNSRALNLSREIKFGTGIALANKNLGMSYFTQGDYVQTLDYWNRSLVVYDSIGDKRGVANILSNLGVVFLNQGDDATALDYFLRSLRIAEEISDTLRIITLELNIGSVYLNKVVTYPEAMKHLKHGLPLAESLGDKEALGTLTGNLGELFLKMNQLDSALFYFEKSKNAYDQDSENLPYTLINIGNAYRQKGDLSKAIDYQSQALETAESLESKNDICIALIALGRSNAAIGNTQDALKDYVRAEGLAKEVGLDYQLKEVYEGLSSSYARMGNYSKAFDYQQKLLAVKDSLFNGDIQKKLGTLQFSFDIEKKQNQINLLTKDQELKQQEIRRQKLVRNGFIGGFAIMLLFAGVFLSQRNRISKEKKRSDELLLNILPEETAEELKATGTAQAKSFDSVTVMFTDFKNFTKVAEKLTPSELVEYINHCFSEFDRIVMRYDIEKIKTIGDAYMCAGGLPVTNSTHPQDLIMAGLEMQEFMRRHKLEREAQGLPYMELRLGIHTGPVVAGIVGIKKFAYDVWGDTVNTASRMESSGEPGKVNISGTTYELVKGRFSFTHRGRIPAKNKGEIDMYFVDGLA